MPNQQRRLPSPTGEESVSGNGPVQEFALAMEAGNGSVAVPPMPEVADLRPRRNQSWRWLLISLMGCITASGAAIGAFVWLINLPPTADCETVASVTTDRARLYCAQVAAETGNLDDILASLKLVGGWNQSHPLHYEVQPLVEQWSWVALKEAQQKLGNSDLEGAIKLIDYIPITSPVYETAQDSLQAWNAEWDQGDAIWQEAQAALQEQRWDVASRQILALAELQNRHWRVNQVQALSQQIRQERQARRQLARATAIAGNGGVPQLGAALKTASQISQTTYAYQDAQPYMDRWSDWLLNIGLDKWYASDLDEAIRLGHNAAVNPNRAKSAQELIWLSQARQLAQASIGTWRTSPEQLVKLYRAMVMANRIPRDSAYYPQAQSSVTTWRTHLADLGKLQLAQLPGRIQNLDTLKLAMDQAAQIPQGSPRRRQAQTLMAHWRLETERLEDQPYLARAHQLANLNTVDGLQQAIETASQIPVHRALRNEAQSWIYVWNNQIEVLQDRPILAAARELADDSNYSQAIAKASNIRVGRALYDEAQTAIAGWRREIYAIEQARQRAAARRRQAELSTAEPSLFPSPVLTDDGANDPATSPDLTPRSAAPDPLETVPRRQPLPQRIETVPEGPSGETAPVPARTPVPLDPQPASAPGGAPPANDSPVPLAPKPGLNPVPVSPGPAPAPDLSLPIPAAPAPHLPAVPPAAPEPNGATAPAPAAPEADTTAEPSVSTAPKPEQTVSIKTTADTGVLFTGALYTVR